MSPSINHLGQPVGPPLPHWRAPLPPAPVVLSGRFCRLDPLHPDRHAAALFAANSLDREGRNWTYLPYGPFPDLSAYRAWMEQTCLGLDPLFFAIIGANGQAAGVAALMRIAAPHGCIEVGHLNYSPALQCTPAATEAMFLLMRHVFDLGYRRYEWKCDALNAPSRAAARRLGFSFEGIFRQATVYKGRSRDTAWHAIIDAQWPSLRPAFETWLDPANFDAGRQRLRLSDLTRPILNSTAA